MQSDCCVPRAARRLAPTVRLNAYRTLKSLLRSGEDSVAGGEGDANPAPSNSPSSLDTPSLASSRPAKCSLTSTAHGRADEVAGRGGCLKTRLHARDSRANLNPQPITDIRTSLEISLTLLGSVEESSVFRGVTDFDDLGARQELHDEAGGDNGRNPQLHQRAWKNGRGKAQPT